MSVVLTAAALVCETFQLIKVGGTGFELSAGDLVKFFVVDVWIADGNAKDVPTGFVATEREAAIAEDMGVYDLQWVTASSSSNCCFW